MSQPPYEVLGVAASADDETIRQRYLELVREFPPDRDPQRFAEIRAAYDDLRDPVKSLQRRLFSVTAPQTLEAILAAEQRQRANRRYPTHLLLSLADI